MKKAIRRLCCLTMVILAITLYGCTESANDNVADSNSKTDIGTNGTKEEPTLKNIFPSDKIKFDNTHVEISVYSDENFHFSNKNEEFYEKFTEFIKNAKFTSKQTPIADEEKVYVSVDDGEELFSFSIYRNDIITVDYGKSGYYCEGVYNEFINTFNPFFNENKEYCRSGYTPIMHFTEYIVYDKNLDILECDSIERTPYLFYDSGIVHLWAQAGTGTLTRWAIFFDVENGSISPTYYGQTDYFGNMVCATNHSKVDVYEMFSGEHLYCFDTFEKPLDDCMENIYSAYFSKDGSQIIIEYLSTDLNKEQQIFDLPQT